MNYKELMDKWNKIQQESSVIVPIALSNDIKDVIDQAKLEGQIENCQAFLNRLNDKNNIQLFNMHDQSQLRLIFESKIEELKKQGEEIKNEN